MLHLETCNRQQCVPFDAVKRYIAYSSPFVSPVLRPYGKQCKLPSVFIVKWPKPPTAMSLLLRWQTNGTVFWHYPPSPPPMPTPFHPSDRIRGNGESSAMGLVFPYTNDIIVVLKAVITLFRSLSLQSAISPRIDICIRISQRGCACFVINLCIDLYYFVSVVCPEGLVAMATPADVGCHWIRLTTSPNLSENK